MLRAARREATHRHRSRCWLALVAAILVGVLPLHGAPPPAGTEIVNQGAVYYKDETGTALVTQTNVVVLTVRQVYSATLDGDGSRFGAAGQEVGFFHTLTNTGNGPELFCVSVADGTGDSGSFTRIRVIRDTDNSGTFDAGEPLLDSASSADAGILHDNFRMIVVRFI